MVTLIERNAIYNVCDEKPVPKPDLQVNEAIMKRIASDFRTLPTFEKSVYEQVRMKSYSLKSNDRLKCCWDKYKEHIETREFTAFQFPDIKDLHYRNYCIEFLPKEKRYLFNNKKILKPGPGVDIYGQMPIPQELLMRRTGYLTGTKKDRKKIKYVFKIPKDTGKKRKVGGTE